MKLLDILIDDYFVFYLYPKIEQLKKSHDLDVKSQTNSIKLFNQEYSEILNKYTNDVINHLSLKIKKELLIYFSIDGLLLYIINQFQKKLEE